MASNPDEAKKEFEGKVKTTMFDNVLRKFFDVKTGLRLEKPLVPGLLGMGDLRILLCEISELPAGIFLEMGVLGGLATMAMSMTHDGLTFLCVDRWRRGGLSITGTLDNGSLTSWRSFLAVSRALEGRVIGIEGDSEHILSRLESTKIVGALHDGAHDYRTVRSDIEWIWPMILPGGKFIAHDYHDPGTGVKQALDEYFSKHEGSDAEIQYMEHGYFVAIKQKESSDG